MSTEVANKRVIVWGSICLFWFTITPFASYYLYIFYRHRNHMQLKKRHYETVLCGAAFCFIFWTLERPLGLIWSSQILVKSEILSIIHYTIFPFTIYGLLWSFCWRYWLVYYQIQLASATYSNNKWKSIININNEQIDWFLLNKNTFGNIQWTFKRFTYIFLLFFIISSIIQIIPSVSNNKLYPQTTAILLDGTLNLLSFSILLTIWFKTPRFEDSFFIRDELRYIVFAYVALYFSYFVGTMINSLIFHSGNYFLLTVFQTYCAVIFTCVWFYLSTRWILRKFDLDTRKETYFTMSGSKISQNMDMNMNRVAAPSPLRKQYSESAANLKLYELLQTNDGFKCFMNHLIYEFSHECLMSFIEFIQFRKAFNEELAQIDSECCNDQSRAHMLDDINENNQLGIKNKQDDVLHLTYNKLKTNCNSIELPKIISLSKFSPKIFSKPSQSITDDDKILSFELPDIVPQSFIVYNNFNEENQLENETHNIILLTDDKETKLIDKYKTKAYKLYEKYVMSSSDFEININSKQRNVLNQFMVNIEISNIDCEELLQIYDYCIYEMYRLMQDSFNRFKTTQRFVELDKAKLFQKGLFQF